MAIKVALIAICIALSGLSPAMAQSLTPADREALAVQSAVLERAVSTGDFAASLDVVPPRLIRTIAEQFGATPADVRAAIAEAGRSAYAGIQSAAFTIDIASATSAMTPDGARPYFLIPTETTFKLAGGPAVRVVSQTLAFQDDGWWLIRVSYPQQAEFLRAAYPEFAGVTFPPSQTFAED